MMASIRLATVLFLVGCAMGYPEHRYQYDDSYPFSFISRETWGANPPTSVTPLVTPVPYVVLHHTEVPTICLTTDQCMQDMRSMQNFHQNTNGWADIGYNFAVGGEGSVYEGRGWEAVGTHASGYNSQSIGIGLIGNFASQLPPNSVISTTEQLISEGIRRGYIRADFELVINWKFTDDGSGDYPFTFVSREAWGANPPTSVTPLVTPVPYVVLHHTEVPGICLTMDQCIEDMQSMQTYHQNTQGWADIGYNFAVGGEGSVYEGRGWETVGTHASGYNSQSIGIAVIGNYTSELPPAVALLTVKLLISQGIKRGFISEDYELIRRWPATETKYSSAAMSQEIQTWNRFLGAKTDYPFTFISRETWGANPPTSVTPLVTPVPYVVLHHTEVPAICLTTDQCMRDMRSMQNFHQNTNGWADIGYNFAVGGEGSVYEGRGWEAVGTHASGYNSQSIGIGLIGNFASQLPPNSVISTTEQLISEGIRRGYIRADFELVINWKFTDDGSGDYPFKFVSREVWGANPPTSVTPLNTPVKYVVLHHTIVPGICLTMNQCIYDMQAMQRYHQNTQGWADIGYNFAVGGEGSVYEGRGWDVVGTHASGYNSQSIGIAVIGNYTSELPPAVALLTTKLLISQGVKRGFISEDYELIRRWPATTKEFPVTAQSGNILTLDRFLGSKTVLVSEDLQRSLTTSSSASTGLTKLLSNSCLSTTIISLLVYTYYLGVV